MNEEKELPAGWVRVKLEEVVFPGGTYNPRTGGDGEFLYVDIEAVDNIKQIIVSPKCILNAEAPSRARMAIKAGDVIFSLVRPYLKNIAVVPLELDGQVASTAYCVMRSENGIASSFIFFSLLRESFINSIKTYGGTPPAARDIEFLSMTVPIAPLPEQQRIVAAIEERFTILDAVATALQQDKQKLKRARASVLKYAVEGKLTEQWRAEHPVTESGSQLLERILAERRAKWEAEQLAKGKDPRKLRYDEPKGPDVSELPEVPEGWCWATVEQIANVIGGVTKGRDLVGRKTLTLPYLRVANVQRGYIDTSIMKSIEVLIDECERYLLHKGDIVLTEGGDADKLGRAAVWGKQIEDCIHQNHIFRARLINRNMPSKWLECYTNSEQGRAYFLRSAKQTVNLASINMTQLKRCPLPLPPLAEQQQIVAEVERRLSVIEQAQVAIETSLKRIERARQSILEQAFSGLLVPQDPHDEPASVLLERIQQERASRAGEGKQRARNGAVKVVRNRKTPEQAFVPQWQLLQEAQQSASIQDGASESSEVRQGEMDREELGELVQMPLFSQWD